MDSEQQAEPSVVVAQKHELVRQLQFAPGFHFLPTEVELVDFYLRGKIEGRQLPLDVVNEVIILEWQPGRLVETYKAYGEQKWYFFTAWEPSSSNKEKEPNRKVRVPGVNATWKATGSVTVIRRKGKDGKPLDKEVIGTKRVLIYHSSDADEHGKWSMHEYVLTSNSQIGQYVLCSIQRKQHSDTEDNAGEASGSSKRKTETTNMEEHEKTTTKRKKKASTQEEGAQQQQQQQQEITPHVPEKTAKRKKKASRQVKGAQQQQQEITAPVLGKSTKRKKKASTQVEAEQQKHQQKEMTLPLESPLMPREQDHQMLQQEQPSVAFDDATDLPSMPQGYASDGNLLLRASAAPADSGHAHAHSFLQSGHMTQFLMQNRVAFCAQGEQLASFQCGSFISQDSYGEHAHKYQPSQQENYGSFGVPNHHPLYTGKYLRQNADLFSGNSTQNNNSNWEPGQDQFYQQWNEGAFGEEQYTHSLYYQFYEQRHGGVFEQTTETCYGGLDDQFTERSVQDHAVALKGGDINDVACPGNGFATDIDFECLYVGLLPGDAPEAEGEVGSGTQEDSNRALQSQHELQRPCGQQQHENINGHLCGGPSSGCSICFCP